MLATSLLLVYYNFYHYVPWIGADPLANILPFLVCVATGIVVSARYLQRMASRYHRLSWIDSAGLTTRQIVMVAMFIFAFMFAFKERTMSRLFIGSYLGFAACLLFFVNHSLPRFLSQLFFGRNRLIPTLFIGSPKSLDRLGHWLASKETIGVQPVGFLCDQAIVDQRSGMPFIGPLMELQRAIERHRVVQVISLEVPRTHDEARFIMEACQSGGCRLLIYENIDDRLGFPMASVNEEGHHFYTMIDEPLEDPVARMLKRAFDLVVALPVVVLLVMPMSLVVWIMQRLQAPGCLYFVQERTGFGQKPFHMMKFRSMYAAGRNPNNETQQACRGDKRVFPFGRFLRRSSMDEFPQFINVLKGDMSIVGPRPHMVAHDREFGALFGGYRTRFFVKPGITGLAQCNGFRGEITDPALLRKRVEHDLAYVTQWSLWLDLQITVKTAGQVLFPPRAAY